jgi:phage terminase small subunit
MPILPNSRHERFAQALADGKSAEEAHGIAGYKASRSGASQLKQKVNISRRVTELLAEREKIHAQSTAKAIERVSLTKEWVLARLIDNAERALQAVPVRDREGNETGEYQYQGSVANRSLELLGKHLGMFIDVHELSGPDKGPIQTQEVSPRDKLADRIAGIATARAAKDNLG